MCLRQHSNSGRFLSPIVLHSLSDTVIGIALDILILLGRVSFIGESIRPQHFLRGMVVRGKDIAVRNAGLSDNAPHFDITTHTLFC